MTDKAASVLAKLKNKAKISGISYQQCLQLFMQEELNRKTHISCCLLKNQGGSLYMKYINVNEILPGVLVEELQKYTLSEQRNTRSEKNQFLLLLRCFPSAYVQYASVKRLAGTKIGFFPTLRPWP